MSPRFKFALILAICGALLNLVLFFTGLQTDRLATGQYFTWLQEVILVVVLWLGIKATRRESPGHALTYGQGVKCGVLISLYGGLMSGLYNAFHFKFVNPHFADYQLACLRPQLEAAGLTNAQIAQAEIMTRMWLNPLAQAILAPVNTVCIGLVISLILAAFLRRPAFAGTSPPMPQH